MILNKYFKIILFLFVVFFSIFVFTYNITESKLDKDEQFTINILNLSSLPNIIVKGNIEDSHPPIYHIILYLFISCFGLSELTIKIFSVIFAVFSIIGIFILSNQIYSYKESITSMFIMLTVPYIALIAQDARSYMLFFSLSIYTVIFLVDIIKNINENKILTKTIILYIIFAVLSLYTHYYALLLISLEFSFLLLFFGKTALKKILLIFFIVFLLFVPWMFFIKVRNIYTVYPNFLDFLEWNICGGFKNNKFNYVLFIGFLIGCFSIFVNIFKQIKQEKMNYIYDFMLLWLSFIPFIIVFVLYYFGFKCYHARYLIFSLVPFYIIISRGICLFIKSKYLMLLLLSMFTIFVCNNTLPLIKNENLLESNPKDIVCFVKENFYKVDNSILVIGFRDMSFEYYLTDFNKEIVIPKDKIFISYNNDDIERFIKEKEPSYIWLIDDDSQDNYTFLKSKYNIIEKEDFPNDRSWLVSLFSTLEK